MASPCHLPPGRGKALFVLTQPLPSLRRSPHPALRATCPIPFVPSGHFPLTRGIGPRGRLPSQSRLRRASSPKGGAKVAPSGLCSLPPPVGEVPRRGGEGRPQNTKKALPPWGCQGGRGRRGRGCARGIGQPRLNSGDFSRCSGRAECSVSSFVSDQGEWITSARQRPAPRRPRSCRSGSWRRPCSCPDRWRGPCP